MKPILNLVRRCEELPPRFKGIDDGVGEIMEALN
jgi:hypothetical protein